MAITPQSVNMMLLIPKGIELGIFVILVILLYRRIMEKPPEQRYILNKLFIFSFICWVIYISCDMIVYNLAAAPFLDYAGDIAKENQITGYPDAYPEVLVAQILRDVGMFAAFVMTYTYLAAALVIRKSERWTQEHFFQNKLSNFIFIVLVILLVAGDQIGVWKEGDSVWALEKWGGFSFGALSIFIIIIMLTTSAVFFFKTMMQMDKSDTALRRRSQLIGMGILLMAMGGIYWMVWGILTSGREISYNAQMTAQFIGHMIWTISPMLIYLGLKR